MEVHAITPSPRRFEADDEFKAEEIAKARCASRQQPITRTGEALGLCGFISKPSFFWFWGWW